MSDDMPELWDNEPDDFVAYRRAKLTAPKGEYPPYRTDPQGPLTEAFGARRSQHIERLPRDHPDYFCAACRWRFSARAGGLCGPCIGAATEARF